MSETKVFLLPDLGEGLTEAELVNWLVAVGDDIRVDQPIAEVETAKSMVEVPSPYAGTVAVLHGEPGQTLDVGKPLISVTPIGAKAAVEPVETKPKTPVVEPVESAAAETYREEEKAGSGNVLIGYGTPGGHGQARRTRARKHPVVEPVETGAVATRTPAVEPVRSLVEPVETSKDAEKSADDLLLLRTRVPGRLGAVISPLVRRMARDHGVDLGGLQGSGTSGLIMRKDVEAAIAPSAAVEPVETSRPVVDRRSVVEPVETHLSEIDPRTGLGISSRTPVRGVRKAVASNMTRSRSEIPEATVWVDVDATALVEMRAALKKTDPHNTPGLLAFIARFVTAGLKKYPELNTRMVTTEDAVGGESQEIIAFDGVNLGFAAQTDRGLMVPSIRNADRMSARELDAEIRRLTAIVREGKATPSELGSGTFTLNNYGVFGVDGSAAIINHPEVGILGVGRIMDRPWVVNGELAVRKVTELTLTFDHRVCDGATAGGFLRYVADAIENTGIVLADL
ncbi:pyruvate dehydrogenase E2 component (dihydrolipoamide acetyltransferase) [Arthrobacter sp. PvP102]|uniref:dihydrolipoamide acetyltransferase family protein n=1 Tax=unclassified Arthrobacter TaxID=235627 RepID=UPI001AE96DB1|nr:MULTISPECIES: dihydrolipoamide acetyltransferase family protein [unclassified Arthrobacter]MBP1232499.1 pyruvate dehydrogenase E2 component (dihydrolipoamide acetyltransferase) [Arthrobacter sp. PvP103]MBP1237634.1 pyruvate dehydrogenase E2 component (dihydrolipoamide acetyltransferase) [Arthrobacter sp. PvP102]